MEAPRADARGPSMPGISPLRRNADRWPTAHPSLGLWMAVPSRSRDGHRREIGSANFTVKSAPCTPTLSLALARDSSARDPEANAEGTGEVPCSVILWRHIP